MGGFTVVLVCVFPLECVGVMVSGPDCRRAH